MTDFIVRPLKQELVKEAALLASRELDLSAHPHPVEALVAGAVELLWHQDGPLDARTVVDTLSDGAKLQAAMDRFEEQASYLAIWLDQFRTSPFRDVDPTRLPRRQGK